MCVFKESVQKHQKVFMTDFKDVRLGQEFKDVTCSLIGQAPIALIRPFASVNVCKTLVLLNVLHNINSSLFTMILLKYGLIASKSSLSIYDRSKISYKKDYWSGVLIGLFASVYVHKTLVLLNVSQLVHSLRNKIKYQFSYRDLLMSACPPARTFTNI